MANSSRLGQGLAALLGETSDAVENQSSGPLLALSVTALTPSLYQPRKQFDPEALSNLSSSIEAQGILQPLIVRALDPSDRRLSQGISHEILAGERRWRAAQMAGLLEVPALLREISDAAALEIGLVENIQRQDLDPLEEALALRQLIDQFSYTQEQVAQAVGKSRSAVANALRLLNLPTPVQALMHDRNLSAGHARALVGLSDSLAIELAEQAVRKEMNVRVFEALVRTRKREIESNEAALKAGPQAKRETPRFRKPSQLDEADLKRLEDDLGAHLGVRAKISLQGKRGGTLKLDFKKLEQLDAILARLVRNL